MTLKNIKTSSKLELIRLCLVLSPIKTCLQANTFLSELGVKETLFSASEKVKTIKLAKLIQTVDTKGKVNYYFEYQTNDFLVSDKR